jgi:hypothetical protein
VEWLLYGHRGALTVEFVASTKAARLRGFGVREGMTKGDWAVSTTFRSSKLLPRGLPLPIRNPRLPPASLISHCQLAITTHTPSGALQGPLYGHSNTKSVVNEHAKEQIKQQRAKIARTRMTYNYV